MERRGKKSRVDVEVRRAGLLEDLEEARRNKLEAEDGSRQSTRYGQTKDYLRASRNAEKTIEAVLKRLRALPPTNVTTLRRR